MGWLNLGGTCGCLGGVGGAWLLLLLPPWDGGQLLPACQREGQITAKLQANALEITQIGGWKL